MINHSMTRSSEAYTIKLKFFKKKNKRAFSSHMDRQINLLYNTLKVWNLSGRTAHLLRCPYTRHAAYCMCA